MCVRACVRARACVCVCVCARACMCVSVRERDSEREFCPLSGFRYTVTLRPVPVCRTEATRIGSLGITAAYRQPYSRWTPARRFTAVGEKLSTTDRLVGLVVEASAFRAEDSGFESRLRRDFFGVESYQ